MPPQGFQPSTIAFNNIISTSLSRNILRFIYIMLDVETLLGQKFKSNAAFAVG